MALASMPLSEAHLDLEWIFTLGGALLGGGLLALAVWQDGRPKRDTIQTRWVSWRLVMFFAAAIVLLALVHAANKLGFRTGRNGFGPN